jgi:hypothetical protein
MDLDRAELVVDAVGAMSDRSARRDRQKAKARQNDPKLPSGLAPLAGLEGHVVEGTALLNS